MVCDECLVFVLCLFVVWFVCFIDVYFHVSVFYVCVVLLLGVCSLSS